ncbi:hypothetical protein D018_2040A, partial [Vibrio parahaemolyticus VP2007-007]
MADCTSRSYRSARSC